MYAEDAKKRGIENGSRVEVESPLGKIEFEARTEEKAPLGVVVVDFGWGNPWDNATNILVMPLLLHPTSSIRVNLLKDSP